MIEHLAEDPGLKLEECALCKSLECAANLVFCFICEDPPDICGDCMAQHLTETHTQIEYMKAEQELTA